MKDESTGTYFDHYKRCNDFTSAGKKRIWHEYRCTFLDLLPPDRNVRILDFGCGAGLLLEWLRVEGYTGAEGVDSDSGQVAFAKESGANVTLSVDTTAFVRQAGLFDVIFMTDVLEHIPLGDDLDLLRSLGTALRPGGTLILRVPNANASFGLRNRYIDPTHQRSYTELSLAYDLERAGFSDIKVMSSDVWVPRDPKDAIAIGIRFVFRCLRRLEAISENGTVSLKMPLSANLIATTHRR